MEKLDRKVTPGKAMEVGMCVVYFGSHESFAGVPWVGKEIRDEAGKAAEGQVRMALNAGLRSLELTMQQALF